MGNLRQLPLRRGCSGPLPDQELPRLLADLIAAGMRDFAIDAVTAWGRREMEPGDLLDLCRTYAAVAGLRAEGGML